MGSATANETDCVDCHDVALLAPGLPTSYVGHAPAGVGVRAAGQNPYMLRSVTAAGQYDNLCRICHGSAAAAFKGAERPGHLARGRPRRRITENDATADEGDGGRRQRAVHGLPRHALLGQGQALQRRARGRHGDRQRGLHDGLPLQRRRERQLHDARPRPRAEHLQVQERRRRLHRRLQLHRHQPEPAPPATCRSTPATRRPAARRTSRPRPAARSRTTTRRSST